MLNALIDFRLYYMRFLADSWAADRFNTQAQMDAVINNPETNPKGLMDLLYNEYHYESPWRYIRVEMIVPPAPAAVKWDPLTTAGWICPNDYFIINLPRLPEGINQNDQVSALAAYYQNFPTLLGLAVEKHVGPGPQGAIAPLGIDPGPFLEFGGITLRALALAWKNNDFLNELAAPKNLEDATPVLSKWLGFTNPWNFKLQFIFDNSFHWNGNQWDIIPMNTVKMHFPARPSETPDYWPIALTSYNNTGPAYPFTC